MMSAEGTGFRVLHQDVSGVGTVERVGVGGSGAQIINFTIVSSDPATRSAIAEVVTKSFTGAPYGEILPGVVQVYDTKGCNLTETSEQLTARRGDAVLMIVNDAVIETHFAEEAYPPAWYWMVLEVCCAQTTCDPV